MSKQNVETPEIEALGEVAISRTEAFFETNGKKVAIVIFALLIIASALFGVKSLILDPKEQKASEAIYVAQAIFEGNNPNYQEALEGNESDAGFLEVIENYGSTKAGNIARYYAGICYIKLGDNDNAKSYLSQYKAQKGIPAQIINAQCVGLLGDIAVDEGNYAEAIKLYKNAVAASDNPATAPLYIRKAGQAAQAMGDVAQAKALYKSIVTLYPTSAESRNAEKYLGTIKE